MKNTTESRMSDYLRIGEAFLSDFGKEGFERLPASSLLHDSVPMSFVMSAGLIQVENELERIVERTGGKFAFTQPCFRHFDMKQVGEDPTRLSLFHMSAAFNIGSSKRETVLPHLWQFLTQTLGLEKDRLWITYLDDQEFGQDKATYQCWLELGVDPSKLIGLDQEHCFWRQRSTGQIASDGKKCGPHTEVFYERVESGCPDCISHKNTPGTCRCGHFVEISNSLFIENYIADNGSLIPADTVFAECVVGLERIAMILQDVVDVYHIQRFEEWRSCLKEQFVSIPDTSAKETSINIILDHLSAFTKLVENGAPSPGRGGRKAIMRKLARGAMTQLLLHDIEVIPCLQRLLNQPEEQISKHFLQNEYDIYIDTIHRVQRKLNRNPALIKEISEQGNFEGMPFVLLQKHLHAVKLLPSSVSPEPRKRQVL